MSTPEHDTQHQPTRCMRELDIEPTGVADGYICLGEVDPISGHCRTCGSDRESDNREAS